MGEPAGVKPPIPSPNKIVTVLEKKFAVARSGLPSRLKSPTTTELGPDPTSTGEPWGCVKPPIPSPNKIVTVEAAEFAVARSGLPSRLKSPTTTERGPDPTSTGEPWGCVKMPSPLPSWIVTLLELEFAVA